MKNFEKIQYIIYNYEEMFNIIVIFFIQLLFNFIFFTIFYYLCYNIMFFNFLKEKYILNDI